MDFGDQSSYQYEDLYVQGNHYGRRRGEWVSTRVAVYFR